MNAALYIENEKKFIEAIDRSRLEVGDLRIPLALIAMDFYKSEKSIFGLKGPGQYQDLSPKYKKAKQKKVGFVYPILKRTGRLADSLTKKDSADSIYEIVDKSALYIGSKVPYGGYHNFGEGMPKRPFLFIGPEAPRYATSDTQGRLERWNNIMNSYVLEKMKERLE